MTKRLINKSLHVVLLTSILVACNLPQYTAAAIDPSTNGSAHSAITHTYVHHKKHIRHFRHIHYSHHRRTNTTQSNSNTEDLSMGLTNGPTEPTTMPTKGIMSLFKHTTDNTDPGDLWSDLRSGFQLEHYENTPQVQAQIVWFMHNQGYLYRTTMRAAPYMYYIYQQVKERHLPAELVLLPVLESAYNPFASSNRGAAGLWQLERGTASAFGVKQDWWYDGRRDVLASTNAALDYLTYLQNFFGTNWYLALAAYDSGEGTVQEAMRRNIRDGYSTDFWSLPLPMETQSYVPRLLALATIIENPQKYSIYLPSISDAPYLGQVDIGGQIDLNQAASLAGISLNELIQLNPGYVHYTTDPQGPHKLLLPFDKIQTFQDNLLTIAKIQTTSWDHYKVQTGDTLESVAQQFNTSVNILQQVNHLHSYKLTRVKVLLIPYTNNSTNTENNTVTNSVSNNKSAIVQADNAAAQAAAQAALAENNNNVNNATSNAAPVEQVTTNTSTENNSSVTTAPITQNVTHTIRRGETLGSIAKYYHVSVNDLRRWNKINPKHLKPGMLLIIQPATTNASNNVIATTAISHTIKHKIHTKQKPIKKIKPQIVRTHPVVHKTVVKKVTTKHVIHPVVHTTVKKKVLTTNHTTHPVVRKSVTKKVINKTQQKNIIVNNPTINQTGN